MKVKDKKRTYLILAVVFIAVFMGGAFLLHKLMQGNDLISIGSEDTNVLESNRLLDKPLNPGDKEECEIQIKMDMERIVDISIWFSNFSNVEKQEVFTSSIYVGLRTDDKTIESKPMCNYTEQTPLICEITLGGKTNSFYLIFEMPSWVGNEMLNVYSEFNISILVEGGYDE